MNVLVFNYQLSKKKMKGGQNSTGPLNLWHSPHWGGGAATVASPPLPCPPQQNWEVAGSDGAQSPALWRTGSLLPLSLPQTVCKLLQGHVHSCPSLGNPVQLLLHSELKLATTASQPLRVFARHQWTQSFRVVTSDRCCECRCVRVRGPLSLSLVFLEPFQCLFCLLISH